jgi:hypothetical protein
MEYLGQHNKPKAEVHPGHKVTGPKEEDEEEGPCFMYLFIKLHNYHSCSMQNYTLISLKFQMPGLGAVLPVHRHTPEQNLLDRSEHKS